MYWSSLNANKQEQPKQDMSLPTNKQEQPKQDMSLPTNNYKLWSILITILFSFFLQVDVKLMV